MVGIGAALSNTIGGVLIQRAGYNISFLSLGGVALCAFALLWLAVPETLHDSGAASGPPSAAKTEKASQKVALSS
ncbi:MAG TPA: hypothetical protein VGD60_14035 [Candidatus Acidoferrales bacterium]